MSRAFNFYGFAESGQVSAYPTQFSGFYTPSGMINSPDTYYYRMDHESIETAPTYNVNVSGTFKGTNIHEATTSCVFHGSFFGIQTGDGTLYSRFTGNLKGANVDPSNLSFYLTGNFRNSNLENSSLLFRITGNFPKAIREEFNNIFRLSGNFVGVQTDTFSTQINLTGNFIKHDFERVLLGVNFSGASWSVGYVKRSGDLGNDTGVMGIYIRNVYWSRAG